MPTRSSRRAQDRGLTEHEDDERRQAVTRRRRRELLPRIAGFAMVAVLVLGAGIYLAGSVFLGQRGQTHVTGAVPMRISMSGFDPRTIDAKPGQVITLDWWNTDAAMHLQGGVHTLVSDALHVRYALPAESRETITLTAPAAPGDYDFWCDSCCGGKGSPDMHGTLHVAA